MNNLGLAVVYVVAKERKSVLGDAVCQSGHDAGSSSAAGLGKPIKVTWRGFSSALSLLRTKEPLQPIPQLSEENSGS